MANVRRGKRQIEALPEDGLRRLMFGVLVDAVRILRRRPTSGVHIVSQRAWVRERQWMESEEVVYPFAFVPICNMLNIDPGFVRRMVLGASTPVQPMRGRRYAAAVEHSWHRLSGPRRPRTTTASEMLLSIQRSAAKAPAADRAQTAIIAPPVAAAGAQTAYA